MGVKGLKQGEITLCLRPENHFARRLRCPYAFHCAGALTKQEVNKSVNSTDWFSVISFYILPILETSVISHA